VALCYGVANMPSGEADTPVTMIPTGLEGDAAGEGHEHTEMKAAEHNVSSSEADCSGEEHASHAGFVAAEGAAHECVVDDSEAGKSIPPADDSGERMGEEGRSAETPSIPRRRNGEQYTARTAPKQYAMAAAPTGHNQNPGNPQYRNHDGRPTAGT
jgi:hypothetical protein